MCDTINAPPLRPQPSPLVPVFAALLAIAVALHNVLAVLAFHFNGGAAASLSAAASAPPSGLLAPVRKLASHVLFTPPPAPTQGGGEAEGPAAGWAGALAAYGVVPLVVGVALLALVVRNGKHLVNKPQLCPQLAVTVAKPPKADRDAKKRA